MKKVIERVEAVNRNLNNQGLFVWFIAPYWGGIGQQSGYGSVEWNVVSGFASEEEMEASVYQLEEKYAIKEEI